MEGMVADRSVWAGRKVLVTGHTGFKGSWLSLWLQKMGAEVTGYALAPHTRPSLFEVAGVEEGMTSVLGDVRDLERLRETLRTHEPEVVLHLAAQAEVREGYKRPVETYSTNVLGTVHLLEAVRATPSVRVVIVITSDKCYENREWVWGYRESDAAGGRDPYSSSKGCAELVVSAYRRSYFSEGDGPALASVRAGNVIGGGDWATHRLVPDTVQAFAAGRPVEIRSPRAVRPWQHVLVPLDGYLTLAERLWSEGRRHAGSWNFGPASRDGKPVAWIVKRLATLWGEGAEWSVDADGDHPHEDTYLHLDCSKARAQLGWTPQLKLDGALEWIVEWYQRYYQDGHDMRALTEAQVARFEERREGHDEVVYHP